MKQSYSLDNNWYILRSVDTYTYPPEWKLQIDTDYWLVLKHSNCDTVSTIGHKGVGQDLMLFLKHAPEWCNKCYQSLPDFPKAKQIQDYFTLYDIASFNISL
jgi:hypothetical protein